jgi:hypothetical protein
MCTPVRNPLGHLVRRLHWIRPGRGSFAEVLAGAACLGFVGGHGWWEHPLESLAEMLDDGVCVAEKYDLK